jgi:hypothetical protein
MLWWAVTDDTLASQPHTRFSTRVLPLAPVPWNHPFLPTPYAHPFPLPSTSSTALTYTTYMHDCNFIPRFRALFFHAPLPPTHSLPPTTLIHFNISLVLVIVLRTQTQKHIRGGGWSHYTDTSEPVDGYGAPVMVTVQSRFEPATFWSLAQHVYQLR